MSSLALARTWRPRRFDELAGQSHVVRALTHALDNDKLHHALLFSGTRGVGKTTLARIIAKCLNCEHGVSAYPCVGDQACSTCREVDQGRYVDLIEIDAASRTGVDDTRDLMDNVQYAPTRGRTKVYLIDEVHMLTKHSFNALLKTLEEPPPRVQFLFATTEPEKIPVTILSRCLQFSLKRLPAAQISERLAHIVEVESLQADATALEEIARAADGSMRDGLSLLDQALAFGGGRLGAEDVREMLGTIAVGQIVELVDAIVAARAGDAIAALEALYSQGIDMRYLLDALARAWQHIAAIQIVGQPSEAQAEVWLDRADAVEPQVVQLFYDITMAGIRDFVHAPDPLVGVKMTVLRMLAFVPASPAGSDLGSGGATTPQTSAPKTAGSRLAQVREQLGESRQTSAPCQSADAPAVAAQPEPVPERADDRHAPTIPPADAANGAASTIDQADAGAATPAPGFDAAAGDHPEDWHALVARLDISGLAAQLANNGVCRHLDAEHVELELAALNAFLATDNARAELEAALARVWTGQSGPRLRVKVVDDVPDTPAIRIERSAEQRQREAVASIENDPIVNQLREQLGAHLRPETIKPHRRTPAAPQRDEQ